MASGSTRSAALLVRVHVDQSGGQPWFAQISAYRNAAAPDTIWTAQTSIDAVCDVIRDWLESVTGEGSRDGDGSVTNR
jgi:hypothetical protein